MATTNETAAAEEAIARAQGAAAGETPRDKVIVRTSIVGIVANVLLATFKAVVGLMSNSIAIVLDAVNNISDAASSVITIVGTKLAARPADKKHPFGYGRIEYLSAMIIAIIVLYAGVTSLSESVQQILAPETPDYQPVTLVIVAVGVVAKVVLGRYVKGVGERVNSDSLVNSGEDATLDSIISASTLVAAGIYLAAGISLEAWLGAIISLVIVKSGIEMLGETLSQILGEAADKQLARDIKATVCSFPEVHGAYDLVLNNYGPDTFNGSVHVEVDDTLTAAQIDNLLRTIQVTVYQKHNVVLTAIGVYSVNTTDEQAIQMRSEVYKAVAAHPHALQVHGFYVDEVAKTIRFDVVVSLDAKDRRKVMADVCAKVCELYPGYTPVVAMDTDFSEE